MSPFLGSRFSRALIASAPLRAGHQLRASQWLAFYHVSAVRRIKKDTDKDGSGREIPVVTYGNPSQVKDLNTSGHPSAIKLPVPDVDPVETYFAAGPAASSSAPGLCQRIDPWVFDQMPPTMKSFMLSEKVCIVTGYVSFSFLSKGCQCLACPHPNHVVVSAVLSSHSLSLICHHDTSSSCLRLLNPSPTSRARCLGYYIYKPRRWFFVLFSHYIYVHIYPTDIIPVVHADWAII